jgi:hypothetical protein
MEKIAFRLRISEHKLNQHVANLLDWLIPDDISVISDGYQSDLPETETETETDHVRSDPLMGFPQWYARYPRKEAKADAEKAWRSLKNGDREHAAKALETWPFPAEQKYIPLPASWLRKRRWEDERQEADAWMPS